MTLPSLFAAEEPAANAWMSTRLRAARQMSDPIASPQIKYLAAAGIPDDDHFEYAVETLGGPAYGRSGWGFSEILTDLLSREPKKVASADLATLQRNLVAQGYAPPDTQADGVWTPYWQGAFRRADRDAFEEVRSGSHFLATPVQRGIAFLGNTIPSAVYQGLIGAAKGMVEQAPETLERGGALGGAAAGAAVGASVGALGGPFAPVTATGGALVGAAVGAGVGFFSDLFGSDEGEEDQTGWERFADALTPFEEYRAQGPKAFFEDLGFIIAATSMLKGVGLAGGAAVTGGKQLAAQGFKSFVTKSIPAQPGVAGRIVGATIKPISQRGSRAWLEFARAHGLLAQSSRPLFRAVNGVYGGLSAAQMGARYGSGIGQGGDKFDPATGRLKDVQGSTISEAIEDAPELSSWVDNTLGLVLFPTRIFPFTAGGAARSFQAMLGDTNLLPYVHAAQSRGPDGRVLSLGQAKGKARQLLGRDPVEQVASDVLARTSYGLNREASAMLSKKNIRGTGIEVDALFRSARSKLIRELKAGDDNSRQLAQRLMSHSYDEPYGFAAMLQGLEGHGSGLDNFPAWRKAEGIAQRTMRQADEGTLSIEVIGGKLTRTADFDIAAARKQLSNMKAELSALRKKAEKTVDPHEFAALKADADALQARYDEIQKSIPKNPSQARTRVPTVVPVLKHDPTRNVPGYMTRQDLRSLADDYDRRAGELKLALKGARDAEDLSGVQELQMSFNDFVSDLRSRDLIDDRDLAKAMGGQPSAQVAKNLRKRARHAGRDVKVDPGIEQELDALGYKLAATGEDVLFLDDLKPLVERTGIGDYTRRAAFFETLGMSPFTHTNDAMFKLRTAHEKGEVHQLLAERGVKLTGQSVINRLHRWMTERNHPALLKRRGERVIEAGPGLVRQGPQGTRFEFQKIDVREMSPGQIEEALGLNDLPPWLPDSIEPGDLARDIFGALKRGAAMGGETSLRHPIDALRQLGKATRANGLPGFTDWMRTWHIQDPRRAGAIVGAGIGAGIEAEGDGGVGDILKGAAIGGIAGASLGQLLKMKAPKGTYGYLPDHLHRVNMLLRYSLSPLFDAGRYMEQNILGAAKADLPAIFAPKRYIEKHYGGEKAWKEAVDFYDKLNGSKVMKVVDDIERRMFARGMLGFSPRHHEVAQAFILKNRGWKDEDIYKTISEVGRYGLGRSALEKSVNFVLFPFSFQKKFLTTMGDFATQAPARAFLVHEGMRRFYELDDELHETAGTENSPGARFGAMVEQYLPLADQLRKINSLAYGISPGRFFLEGLIDNETDLGEAAQIASSFFVPSGAATPIAQAAGGTGDLAVHLFTPVFVTGENIDGLDDILNRYVPAVRDIDGFFKSLSDQKIAVTEGGSPEFQFNTYLDERRAEKAMLDELAQSVGYASSEGLLNSDAGAELKAIVDQVELARARAYPTGFRAAQEFTNSNRLDKQAIFDLGEKPDRSAAEEVILMLVSHEAALRDAVEESGLPSEAANSAVQTTIRQAALTMIEDREFMRLWQRFFASEFGPLERVAA